MKMRAYIGTKIILACPEGNPKNPLQDGYKVVYPDGYISWSPKGVFEGAYREISHVERDMINFNQHDMKASEDLHAAGPIDVE